LPEIGCEDLVHIHADAAQEGAVDDFLIKHRGGLALPI
jgi:hypothetical protein